MGMFKRVLSLAAQNWQRREQRKPFKSGVSRQRSKFCLEPLEPRLLLSTDLIGQFGPIGLPNPMVHRDDGNVAVIVSNQGDEQSTENIKLNQLDLGAMPSVSLGGLCLVDPLADYFPGQVIYLDFDGANNVNYRGPVTVGPFDVPPFKAPEALAGQEEVIVSAVLTSLSEAFSDTGVTFTTTEPDPDTLYSTIYVGGDDAAFAKYGSFLGVAEKVDVGNENLSESAFVFAERFIWAGSSPNTYVAALSETIAAEAGHMLGYAHDEPDVDRGALSSVNNGTVTVEIYSAPSQVTPGQLVSVQVRIKLEGNTKSGPWQVESLELRDWDSGLYQTISSQANPLQITSL